MAAYLQTAIKAAKAGGLILSENFGKITSHHIEEKGENNFVTYVDRSSEEVIIRVIQEQFPEHNIYAEESGKQRTDSTYRWIIDPLDGTTNFIHGIPMFSISIALQKNKEPILGLIYDPLRQELFYAEKGKGAFLNKQKINISSKKTLKNCFIATGFPYKRDTSADLYIKAFAAFMKKAGGIRRIGSAAIDLAYTAAGRFDGFWEFSLSPWDIAAGVLLVEEAGGIVTDPQGNPEIMEKGNILAANKNIHTCMLEVLREYL